MTDVKQGAGFRYSKIMAWGPPIILALALILMVMGEVPMGLTVAALALIFWVIVWRRKKADVGEPGPGV